MATTGAAEKICIHCKQDCAGKPRSKDAQGRYTCQGCLETLKARAAAARPAKPVRTVAITPPAPAVVEEEQSVLASLLTDSPEPCPSCAAPLKQGTVLCNFCGFNKETGQALKTRVMRAPKEKRAKVPGQSAISFSPMWTLGGCVLALGAAFVAAEMGGKDMVMLYVLAFSLVWLAASVVTVIFAFMDQHVGWAICGIIATVTGFLQIPMLYYVFSVNEREHVKSMGMATVLGALLLGVLYVQFPEVFDELKN